MSKAAKPKTPSTKSLNDEEVKRLLEYYRIRFNNIKEDRKEWLKNLEGVKMSSHTFHEQEWELRQLIDKIQEYQQTLSETNIALNNERKRNVTFMNEIENYKIKTKDDRRKMLQLLQFTDPVEGSTQIFHDRRPEKTGKNAQNFAPEMSGGSTLCRTDKENSNSVSLKKCISNRNPLCLYEDYSRTTRKEPLQVKKNVLKVTYPNVEKESIGLDENKYLTAQKDELRSIYENMLYKLEENSKLRDDEMRLQTINMQKRLDELKRRKANLEKENYDLTKMFMDLKFDLTMNARNLNDELDSTRLKNQALRKTLEELEKKAKMERDLHKKEFEKQTRVFSSKLRNQIKNKENTTKAIKEQYNEVEKMYKDKLDNHKKKLERFNRQKEFIKNIFEGDKGFEEGIEKIRERMKKLERYIAELKKLARGDRDHYKLIHDKTERENPAFLQEAHALLVDIKNLIAALAAAKKENDEIISSFKKKFEEENDEEN